MFFRKLNKQFLIGSYTKSGRKIEYGMDTPYGFAGIKYSYIKTQDENELLKVIPESYRDNCTLSLMELNYKIPPHTDSNIEAIVNFYIKTDRCVTQFYYPQENAPTMQIDNQTDGAIFHEGYLRKSVRFMAHPGDAYLLDVSKPHSVFPMEPGLPDRKAICLQILYKSFDEAVEMLKETGYIDD
ncbi:hypothetical protein EB169_07485 [archaeon]|nr:hypothetical protein [archaeon]NDB55656.1 hypothetical protein [archaeon]